jgi:hypothetical protein
VSYATSEAVRHVWLQHKRGNNSCKWLPTWLHAFYHRRQGKQLVGGTGLESSQGNRIPSLSFNWFLSVRPDKFKCSTYSRSWTYPSIQYCWVSGLCSSSGTLHTRKHNVSEPESVSFLRSEGETPTLFDPLQGANFQVQWLRLALRVPTE